MFYNLRHNISERFRLAASKAVLEMKPEKSPYELLHQLPKYLRLADLRKLGNIRSISSFIAHLLSISITFVTVTKSYAKADIKSFCSSPILLIFFYFVRNILFKIAGAKHFIN